jgi:hypothetical protein
MFKVEFSQVVDLAKRLLSGTQHSVLHKLSIKMPLLSVMSSLCCYCSFLAANHYPQLQFLLCLIRNLVDLDGISISYSTPKPIKNHTSDVLLRSIAMVGYDCCGAILAVLSAWCHGAFVNMFQ